MRHFTFALLLLMTTQAYALSEPGWAFRELNSEHFSVIYRADQKALAKRYILAAEQARELLLPFFKEAPDKTIIFISDDTDSSNGMASFLPYPMIAVYPVLPSTLDSIDDYGDWPLEMIVHEYTHILNMYPAHGFYVPLKYIFGGVVRPNAVLPKWYLEGLAVNLESRLTDHGRLRADETQALARALTLGNRWQEESLARINEQELMTWPYGSRPYIFGGWWWNNVQNVHGPELIETWNQNFARRLPFFLNGPMFEKTGKSAADLLVATAETVDAEAKSQLKILQDSSPHQAKPVLDEKGDVGVFALSPSGNKLVYWLSRPTFGSEVRVKIRTQPGQPFHDIASERLFKSVGSLRVRFIDEDHFIFDRLDTRRPRVTYRELYLYDFKDHKVTQLTHDLRAQEPSPSPKGDQLAFIQNDGGRNQLALLTINNPTAAPRVLVSGNYYQRLSGPEFLNDDEILFALHVRAGSERLYVYNLHTKQTRVWNTQLQAAQNPRLTAKGVFVSDNKSHVRNIYLANEGGEPVQAITNTLTHIESSDYDPQLNEVLIGELSSDGPHLMTMPLANHSPPQLTAVKLAPPPTPTTTKVQVSDEPYRPLKYLLPSYWIPFVYTVENGGLLLQGSTANSDPAGRNSYSLSGSYDSITKRPSYGLSYTNSSLPTDISLDYAKAVTFLGASGVTVESQGAGLNFGNYWPFNNRFLRWNVGGVWNETQSSVNLYRRIGPTAGIQYSRLQNPLNERFGYMAELSHSEFVPEKGYLSYGRTYAHLAEITQLGGGFKNFIQLRGAFAPHMAANYTQVDIGDRSVGANYVVNLANSEFLMRGYPSGAFVGRKMLNGNLEFSHPLTELGKGLGTFPLFFKALEMVAFADAIAVDGAAYNPTDGLYHVSHLDTYFMGTGAELRLSTTAGYHLPITFTLGAYYGLNQRYGGGFAPFLGFGLGDLGALQDKTP